MAAAVTRSAYFSALSSADTATFSAPGDGVDVINLDGAGVIFVYVNSAGAASVTASATHEMFMIPAAAGAHRVIPGSPAGKTYSVFASSASKVGMEVVTYS